MSSPVDPSPRRPWLAIGAAAALVILVVNLSAYIWYRAAQSPKPVDTPAPAERTSAKSTSAQELALDRREAGITALREELYDRALVLFEAAQSLDPETPDVEALIELATKMGAREKLEAPPVVAKVEPPPAKPEVEAAPEPRREASASRTRSSSSRRRRRGSSTPKRTEAKVEPPRLADFFVTTEPDDLLIEIDGRPAAISPAKLQLPPGEHRVRLRRGPRVLLDTTVKLALDDPETLEADVRELLAQGQEKAPTPPATEKSGLGADPNLDLVALVDRGAPAKTPTPGRSEPPPPPPISDASRLVVVWPGSTQRDLARTLRGELGIPVEVVGSVSKESLRDEARRVGAVMATPGILARLELRPSMRAAAADIRPYVAVRLDGKPVKSRLTDAPIGVLDEVGMRRTPLHVARLLATESPPPTRRVTKLEDLLSLIQLGVVDTVLVERAALPRLAERTQRELHTLELKPARRALAVAFVEEGPKNGNIAAALRSLSDETRRALGMRTWIQ